jgi:hypothetical protein
MNDNIDPNADCACAILNRREMMEISAMEPHDTVMAIVREGVLSFPSAMEAAWARDDRPACLMCDAPVPDRNHIGMCVVMFGPIKVNDEDYLFHAHSCVCAPCAEANLADRQPIADRAMESFSLTDEIRRHGITFVDPDPPKGAVH